MPVRDIRTRLSLDGEKEFKDALADARREMRVMGSELKLAAAEFQATGDQQGFMAQKSRILGEQIAQQEEIVRSLAERLEYSREHYKDNTRQIDDYAIQLNNARRALIQMRGELDENTQAMAELGNRTRLDEANNEIAKLASELKVAQAEFEATGNRENYLSARSRVLKQEIAQQEQAVEALNAAVAASTARHGENSAETARATVKANEATASLIRMRKELEDTDREAEELGRDSRRVGGQIEDGIGDAADETQGKLEAMFASLSRDVGNIRGSVTISAVTDIADVVGGALSSVAGFVDQYAEERRSQAILGFNARRAGLDDEKIQELRAEVTAMTGDSDTALEALSNLIATGWDIQNIEFAAKSLIGAEITFPETLQAESLAESIQKTISNPEGTAEGEILDLVSMLEQNTEEFQASIKEAGTAMGRANVILGLLNHDVLQEGYNAFINDPEVKGVLNEARVNQAFDDEMTELSGHWADNFMTPLKAGATNLLETANTIATEGIGAGVREYFSNLAETPGIKEASEAIKQNLSTTHQRWTEFAQSIATAFDEARADETDKLLSAQDYTAGMRAEAQNLETQAMQALAEGRGADYYSLTAERDALMDEISETEAFVLERLDRLEEIDERLTELDSKKAEAEATGDAGAAEQASTAITSLTNEAETLKAELNAKWRELGAGAVESMDEGMSQQSEGMTQTAYSAGEASGVSLGNGIAAATPYAVGRAASMADGIMAELARIEAPDIARALQDASATAGAASGSGRGGNVNVNVQVDGRTVARASAPYMNAELGRQASRNA